MQQGGLGMPTTGQAVLVWGQGLSGKRLPFLLNFAMNLKLQTIKPINFLKSILKKKVALTMVQIKIIQK